jgi:hypothetical protein
MGLGHSDGLRLRQAEVRRHASLHARRYASCWVVGTVQLILRTYVAPNLARLGPILSGLLDRQRARREALQPEDGTGHRGTVRPQLHRHGARAGPGLPADFPSIHAEHGIMLEEQQGRNAGASQIVRALFREPLCDQGTSSRLG